MATCMLTSGPEAMLCRAGSKALKLAMLLSAGVCSTAVGGVLSVQPAGSAASCQTEFAGSRQADRLSANSDQRCQGPGTDLRSAPVIAKDVVQRITISIYRFPCVTPDLKDAIVCIVPAVALFSLLRVQGPHTHVYADVLHAAQGSKGVCDGSCLTCLACIFIVEHAITKQPTQHMENCRRAAGDMKSLP